LSEENAQRLVISGLNTLIVSLDGMDRQTYSSYRVNGNFDQVMTGIRNVSEAKQKDASKMELIIQFLVNRDNENQIPEVRRFAKEIDARLKLKSMQILNDSSYERWLPEKKKFRRYESVGGSYVIKGNLPDRCPRLWFNPVITWDGKVVPCCCDKDANHIMGDLKEDTFREIWNGPRYRLFRKCIKSGRQLIDICRNCTSGLRGVGS
jgi:radical SAM protein with 4Fe4S-binding SPASM domain